jgi:hypothetical protein
VQVAFVAIAESSAIGLEARGWDGRVAPSWVVIEDRWLSGIDIMVGGFETIVIALLLDCLVVKRGRRRSVIDRLGMRAASQERTDE